MTRISFPTVRRVEFLAESEFLLCTLGLASLAQSPAELIMRLGIFGIQPGSLFQFGDALGVLVGGNQCPAAVIP